MAERVRETVARAAGAAAAVTVEDAVLHALRARHGLDPKDVRYLHPARTVLILVDDAGVRDADVLVAGALLESRHPGLAAARAAGTTRAQGILAAVPLPGGDAELLRERLVTADADARLIAVVERLDHARHLHQYPQGEWQPAYRELEAAYLPVAEWIGGPVGARFRRWADAFARRLRAR